MGLFSKAPKPNPKLVVEGVEFTFQREHDWWEFNYRGTEFCSFESSLALPTKPELDAILDVVESLKPEMRSRMKKELSEWGDAKPDDGETCSVDIQDFAAERTFVVVWFDGASWGDLEVEFTIKDRAIVDESWGD